MIGVFGSGSGFTGFLSSFWIGLTGFAGGSAASFTSFLHFFKSLYSFVHGRFFGHLRSKIDAEDIHLRSLLRPVKYNLPSGDQRGCTHYLDGAMLKGSLLPQWGVSSCHVKVII